MMRPRIHGLLVLLLPWMAAAEIFVSAGSTWKYLDDESDAGTAWRSAGFDDSTWASGPAQLGYGDGGEATVVNGGPVGNRHITTYFRHSFSLAEVNGAAELTLRIVRDDGAVVYLNGQEIHRANLPSGAIDFTTRALAAVGGAAESAFEEVLLSSALLVVGDNVLATEIHQFLPTSSDISFDLELLSKLPGLDRSPYLQRVTHSEVTVRWRTETAMDSLLRYGPAPDELSSQLANATATTEHELRLQGLAPATRYFYSVGSVADILAGANANYFFETAPQDSSPEPVRIWVLGDSGGCSASAQGCIDAGKVRDSYLAWASLNGRAQLVLMLGDNAYSSGTDSQMTKGIFETFGSVLHNTPVWPAPGNHDFYNGITFSSTGEGPYFDSFTLPRQAEAGGVPSGTEAYYSFDHANVHFISLDSHDSDRSATGAMYTWLEADLQANMADFTIAYWHHPPFSFGSHNSDSSGEWRMTNMREIFVPLLEDYGVDLVLAGHSHSYERSMLIDGHYGKSWTLLPENILDGGSGNPESGAGYEKPSAGPAPHEGTVYSVVGSSSKNSGGLGLHPIMATVNNFEGSMVIEVADGHMDGIWIDMNGGIGDHFRISKPPTAEVPAADHAWRHALFALLILGALACVPRKRRARQRR